MFSVLSATVAGYFVATGLVTTTMVASRGVVHSVHLTAQGQYGEAGQQALAASAVLARIATAELIADLIDAARELSGQTLDAPHPARNAEKAA